MRRLPLVLLAWACSGTGALAQSDATKPSEPGKKLPIDMPSVLIRGEDETAGPLLPGNKLAPDVPGAMAFTLPRPKTALDLDRYLAAASQSVKLPISGATESLDPAVNGFQELRLGTMGPHRYDLGVYLGRTLSLPTTWPSRSVTAIGEVSGLTSAQWAPVVGDWSRWALRLEAAASASTTAAVRWAHRSTLVSPNQDDDLAQSLGLALRTMQGATGLSVQGEGGRVGAPAAMLANSYAWSGSVTGSWHPDWGFTNHATEVQASVGGRTTDRLSYPLAYLHGADAWAFRRHWDLNLGLGVGQVMGSWVADPELAVHYRPSDATDLSAGLRSESIVPSFSDLYLSRRYVAGNGTLLDQRVPVRLELSASHRLGDHWYAHAEASFAQADRWIAWRQAPGAPGLWQPFNPGLSGDTGSPTQQAILGELAAQYQATDEASQHFFYRWRSVQPLGEIVQEAGTTHESNWLHGKLTLDWGGAILLQQLGDRQVAGGPATGTQALVHGGLTYHWSDSIAPFVRLDALPLLAVQPAANYFTPDTLAIAGILIGF